MTKERKKANPFLYISAIVLTILLFVAGYALGAYLNEQKLQEIYDLEHQIRIDSLSNELTFQLVTEDLCQHLNLTPYTEQVAEIGQKVAFLESVYSFDSPQVINLKSYYSLLLIRHYLINERVNAECGEGNPSVLYFYTNYGGCADCEDQGLILSRVHKENPKFTIYSFEYTEQNSAINFFKNKYGVELYNLPVTIYNETPHYGFQSKAELEQLMNVS